MNDPFARLPVVPSFIGAGPPPGDGRHRYVIVVQALGIEKVGQLQLRVQADSTPAWLGFSINVSGHLLGRAVITPGQSSRPRDAPSGDNL